MGARSRWVTRSARRVPESSPRSSTSSHAGTADTASRPCAWAAAARSRWPSNAPDRTLAHSQRRLRNPPPMTDHAAATGLDVRFAWALGIEDTFVPQVHARSGRILDEYVLTQHDRFWREDLRMIRAIGVRHLRYGIPWYQVNPEPGRFDWSWTRSEEHTSEPPVTPI